ncbi:hypothetical protein [Rhodococcus opacus]|uniref:hypothetical protein n=1 Tax=Rhodococcus opacus TaxID=37919 RepID=UPI00080B9D5C|nr:hypothetical protein [Rhodococcus opacus]
MSIITYASKYVPLTGPGSFVVSHEYTSRGAVATSSGQARAGWRACRRRSVTCAFSRSIRYIVETEQR